MVKQGYGRLEACRLGCCQCASVLEQCVRIWYQQVPMPHSLAGSIGAVTPAPTPSGYTCRWLTQYCTAHDSYPPVGCLPRYYVGLPGINLSEGLLDVAMASKFGTGISYG